MSRHGWSGMPGAHLGGAGSRCLGSRVTAYADRAMDPGTLLHWDRHLVSCTTCRHAVAEERRVLDSLRSPAAAAVPGDLRSMLLALGAQAPGTGSEQVPVASGVPAPWLVQEARSSPGRGSREFVPPVPVAPVPVVDRGTPAMHRSARRATVFAGLAAGATAAAAWSLAVAGAPGTSSPSPSVSPGLVQRTRPATAGFANASFTVPNLGVSSVGAPVPGSDARPAVRELRGHSAESTP